MLLELKVVHVFTLLRVPTGLPQSDPMWKQLVDEIKTAQEALKAVGGNFSLGTNGWCLGPGDNASFFDKEIADPSFKIASINGALGWLPPDPAYARMDGKRAWAIPWCGSTTCIMLIAILTHDSGIAAEALIEDAHTCRMEDDLSLGSAEIWVNRTLEHANIAANMKVDGLLGLMWRTWETSPQIGALA